MFSFTNILPFAKGEVVLLPNEGVFTLTYSDQHVDFLPSVKLLNSYLLVMQNLEKKQHINSILSP